MEKKQKNLITSIIVFVMIFLPIEIITLKIGLTAINFNLDDIIVEPKKLTRILVSDYY